MPNIGLPLIDETGKVADCYYCKRQMLSRDQSYSTLPPLYPTREHVHPRAHGGTDWVWACYQCNSIKGDMTERQWLVYMREHPRWWEPRHVNSGNPATNRIPKPKMTAAETRAFLHASGSRKKKSEPSPIQPYDFEKLREATRRTLAGWEAARLKYAEQTGAPSAVPVEYPDDPSKQAGFEHVYRNRLHLLRTQS